MPRCIWECSVCVHEAYAYDEIDHECTDEEGNTRDYQAVGDECAEN